MAGVGRPPKAPGKKAGHSKDIVPLRALPMILAEQPELPEFDVSSTYKDEDGNVITEWSPYSWADITVEWWQMWAESALARDFTSTDWSELRDTALLHSEYWKGNFKLAGELRLRTAKFGATPEDRLRLRIQFAEAVGAEVDTARKVTTARGRFPGMKVDPDAIESA